ncbi:MAG: hypothetical protein GY711_20870 [bacterium]|nr:hypothetical protein [bacterium]
MELAPVVVISLVQTLEVMALDRKREVEATRLRAQLAETRSMALASKLQPHFLFNTLQGISTQIHTRPQAADRMIGHLSRLLRESLSRGDVAAHPLREELSALEPFVENAVEHGIARKRDGGIEAIDDGPGLSAAHYRHGFGLRSVEERLRDLHGEEAGLELHEGENGGLQAVIRLPLPEGV